MLELVNIAKKHHDQCILDGINLKIEGPVFIGIHGRSGAGKTTLLNIIGGLDEDYQGIVKFNGVNIKKNRQQYRLHYVCNLYQQVALLSKWSVKNNLNLYSYFSHRQSPLDEKELLDKLNMREIKVKCCGQLSGGQQQRLALVRGLKKDPAIILCDEPTSALDQENAVNMMKLLKEFSQKAIVIMVSHDVHLLSQYCDRVLYLHEGRLDQSLVASNYRLSPMKKRRKRRVLIDYYQLLKESYKSQKERHLLSVFAVMFGTVCLMLTLVVSYGLKQESFKEIKKLFPTQCISLKFKDRHWLDIKDAATLMEANEHIQGAYLNLPYVDFLGIGKDSGEILFIGDNTRCAHDDLRLLFGRMPEKENEIMLSKNTYERLFGETMGEKTVYGYYQYENQEKRYGMQVVGIVDEYTSMDTIYRRSLDELKIIENLFNLSNVTGDYLMLYSDGAIEELLTFYRHQFPEYEYKEVGADISDQMMGILKKVSYFLYGITGVMLVTIFLLLGMTVYLNITEKMKEIGLFRMIGASSRQILSLQGLDILIISLAGGIGGVIFVQLLLSQGSQLLIETLGFTVIKAIPTLWSAGVVLFMGSLGILSGFLPMHLLSRLSLLDCLKDQGY
ncbi:ATP-binding cassette domain-containing protein [Beduini massiliensis]|uniref:ATP-binding cassette domain-containing protein n=1 Tax=Beduini massiliensis TaxID=1585974 RepID=UPI00059A841A|nr:ATP-binding cassette domain-containing protein [Beduini massiliensis]